MLIGEIKCWTKEQCDHFRENMDKHPQVLFYKKCMGFELTAEEEKILDKFLSRG